MQDRQQGHSRSGPVAHGVGQEALDLVAVEGPPPDHLRRSKRDERKRLYLCDARWRERRQATEVRLRRAVGCLGDEAHVRAGAIQRGRGHHQGVRREVHGCTTIGRKYAEPRDRPTGFAYDHATGIPGPPDDRRPLVEAVRQGTRRPIGRRNEHDAKGQRVRGGDIRDRHRDPAAVGGPRDPSFSCRGGG